MRKLASIQTITDITPIEGKDRIVLASVLGWKVIVTKADFHVGDKCIYVEIDSQLPEKPEFEFLRSKKFRIRTLKLGGVVSQGICFPLSILPPGEYEVDQDVTELLGVTKYDPEEVEGYEPIKTGKTTKKWYQKIWLMKYKWYRQLVGANVRETSGFPSFISKTDEIRCLIGTTKIETELGKIKIADVVNKQMDIKVKSYNENDNVVEYKNIVSYQKYPIDYRTIEFTYPKRILGDRKNSIVCTIDHKFLTPNGYVRADDLMVGDTMQYSTTAFEHDAIPAIYGMLLGDSCLAFDRRLNKNGSKRSKPKVTFCQGNEQKEYLMYKNQILSHNIHIRQGRSGYKPENVVWQGCLDTDDMILKCLTEDNCISNSHFCITKEYCDRLTPLSLALWYMDDGTIHHLNDNCGSPSILISTNSFEVEEVELLRDVLLRKYNINTNLRFDKKEDKKYPSVYITTESTPRFLKIVAPYVPKCMEYKLTEEAKGIEKINVCFDKKEQLFNVPIMEKKILSHSKFAHNKYVYDIEVEGNHNFFANDVLCHNCQTAPWFLKDKENKYVLTEKVDGTSMTACLIRHKRFLPKDKFEYIVCSRNMQLGRDNSIYWQVSDKYNIEAALKNLIGSRDWIAIQGECIGPKVQGNKYGRTEPELYVFNLITPTGRAGSVKAKNILEPFGFNFVPIVNENYTLPDTVEEMLAEAHGQSVLGDTLREGLVVRSKDGAISFKAVDPEFLLHYNL